MKVILLPGADGTGVLFKPFIEVLINSRLINKDISVKSVNLNFDYQGKKLEQNFNIHCARIESAITVEDKNEAIIIIAESYSGLLAYNLLIRQNLHISHVIFVASFLKPPSKLATLAYKMNPNWLKAVLKNTPAVIWGRIMFGKWQNIRLRSLFIEAINQTPSDLLHLRLRQIALATLPVKKINTPCLYLHGNHDHLVAKHNIAPFKKLFTNFEYQSLNGTHFLLQTNPHKAWHIISEWIKTH